MANTIGVEVGQWIFWNYRGLRGRALPDMLDPAIINGTREIREQLEREIDNIVRKRILSGSLPKYDVP